MEKKVHNVCQKCVDNGAYLLFKRVHVVPHKFCHFVHLRSKFKDGYCRYRHEYKSNRCESVLELVRKADVTETKIV